MRGRIVRKERQKQKKLFKSEEKGRRRGREVKCEVRNRRLVGEGSRWKNYIENGETKQG